MPKDKEPILLSRDRRNVPEEESQVLADPKYQKGVLFANINFSAAQVKLRETAVQWPLTG